VEAAVLGFLGPPLVFFAPPGRARFEGALTAEAVPFFFLEVVVLGVAGLAPSAISWSMALLLRAERPLSE
jgi:hypothetical protein